MTTDVESHRLLMQQAFRSAQFPAFLHMVSIMEQPGLATVAELLRFNEFLDKANNTSVERISDSRAGLAVFNIVFESSGEMAATITPPKTLDLVEDITDATPPMPAALPAKDDYSDMGDLVLGLEGLYKVK